MRLSCIKCYLICKITSLSEEVNCMINYGDRKGLGNPNFITEEYKEAVTKFSKLIGLGGEPMTWKLDNSKYGLRYIYIWNNGKVGYVGQSFNPAKRIYDEINECHKYSKDKRPKWLYDNGYAKNCEKFAKDFKVIVFRTITAEVDEIEEYYIKNFKDYWDTIGIEMLNMQNVERNNEV